MPTYFLDIKRLMIYEIRNDCPHIFSDLKRLNISHNIINDVRKYVLGNLTSLESLDISHNNLGNDKLRAER